MISLLQAGYLAGAAAIVVPVVLHLLRHRPTDPCPFPSFMFLQQTAVRLQNRNNLRKRLLLLLRCLILLLLSLAFSWPFLPQFREPPQSMTVILWDQSFSMQATPYRHELEDAVHEMIEAAGPRRPALLGAVGLEVEWSGDFTEDPESLARWFEEHKESFTTSRLESALRQADERLRNAPAADRRIVLITDRQIVPWQDVELTRKLSPGTKLRIVGPDKPGFRNVAITGIRVDTPLTHAGQSLPVCVTVRNFCGKPMTCTMTASCLGEPISGQELKLDALGKSEVTLLVPVKNALPLFGKVHLEVSDELAADNQAWFAANPTDLRRVYLQPDPASSGLDAWDYLRTIIAPTGGNPLAGVEMREDASEIETPGDTPRLLILRDGRKGKLPRRKAAMSFLERGGAIICLWQDSREMREFLSYFDVSCALHGESATRRLKTVDFAHPVFRPFLDIKTAGLFDVLFFDPPTLQLPASARVSARFDNGDPAIAELDVPGGRLILIAAQMTREATDWPVRASFLPTWAQLLAYAGQTESQPASFECGLPIAAGCSIDHVTQMETSQAQDAGPAGFRPTRPGAYLLESAGRRQAVAVNLNECESSPLALAEDDDYEHRLCGEECDVAVAAMPVGIPTRGKNIWWLVIVIAGVFMTAEIVLANRTAL